MKIVPVAQPGLSSQSSDNQSIPTGKPSARERALNKLLGDMKANTQQAQLPPINPNSVSLEEMGSLVSRDSSKEPTSPVEPQNSVQSPTSETIDSSQLTAEPKAPEEPLSSQYAILARQQKAIRQREQQLRAREEAIKAKEEASKPSEPQKPILDESKYISKEQLAKDPFSVLTEMGLTYDQLTELALNGPKPQEIELRNELKALREEMSVLKGETENNKKTFQDQQQQTYKQAVAQIRNEATKLINENPEFETIKETNSINDVVELIEETYKQDGILLTVEEASAEVENYLLEEALKLAKIKKIQQKLMPRQQMAEAKPTDSKQPGQQQLKTLTNSVGTSKKLSARERALLAFEGKLK